MIKITGNIVTPREIFKEYRLSSIERKIVDELSSSEMIYEYNSLNELKFELNLRKNIVYAAIELYRSKVAFATFRESKCNPIYWTRTDEGGFLIKEDVESTDAINDIFINSSEYATECATAILIIYYKAVLNIFPEELFNKMFANIHLMSWFYIDKDLDIRLYQNVDDNLHGDCRYFKNPDVDPLTPEWQGENAMYLRDGLYYGHGIGIRTADSMIKVLNNFRKEDPTESAYLLDSATRPNFKYLSDRYYDYVSRTQP